jgi:phage gp36-like protein
VSKYIDLDGFRLLTLMPPEHVDRLENMHPGWLDAQLEDRSCYVDTRLAKRYRVPLVEPYSRTVISWVVRIVTVRAYLHHGVTADDQQLGLIAADAAEVEQQLQEVANGELSLIDLAASDQSLNPVAFGRVLSYSEASPYVHRDAQSLRGRYEDGRGRGSGDY